MSEMFRTIDDEIIKKIENGHKHFTQLSFNSELESLAKPLSDGLKSPAWRVIDRRLQALRKAGRIAYDRMNGWRVLPNAPAHLRADKETP